MPTLAHRESVQPQQTAKLPARSTSAPSPAHASSTSRQPSHSRIAYTIGQLPLYPSTHRSNPTPSKLTIGSASSPQERQAADTANRLSAHPGHSAHPLSASQLPGSGFAAPPIVDRALRSSGQPLDPATRAAMEPRFGEDLSDVRVHHDALAAASARAIDAQAYTLGRHIVFASASDLHGANGSRLLAHELTHVIQQRQLSSSHTQGVIQRQPATPGYPKPRLFVGGSIYMTELAPGTVKFEDVANNTWVIFKNDDKGMAQFDSKGTIDSRPKQPAAAPAAAAPPPSVSDQFFEATGMKDPRLIEKGIQGLATILIANLENPIPFTEVDAKGNYKLSANPLDFLRIFHGLGGFAGEEKELVSVEKEAENRSRAQQVVKSAVRKPDIAAKLIERAPQCAQAFNDYKAIQQLLGRLKSSPSQFGSRWASQFDQAEKKSNRLYKELLDCLGF